MMRQSVKLFSCLTLILVLVIIRCVTIYPLSFKTSENGRDRISEPNAGRKNEDSNGKKSQRNVGSVNVARPAEEVDFFRDPVEVLGPNFTDTVVANLCNVHLFVTADVVSDVVFLDEGKKLCDRVCARYRKTMKFDGPTDVFLVKGYCDYIGTTDFSEVSEPGDQFDLDSACTCTYKVRRDRGTKVIVYSFRANSAGFLNVLYSEPDQKLIRHGHPSVFSVAQ